MAKCQEIVDPSNPSLYGQVIKKFFIAAFQRHGSIQGGRGAIQAAFKYYFHPVFKLNFKIFSFYWTLYF